MMNNSSEIQNNPEQASSPVDGGSPKARAADRFEIFEQVALEHLQAEADSTKPAQFLPLPVRLTAVAAAGIALLGLLWSVLARVPIQVNATAAIVPPGGLESLNAATSGILRYQVSGFSPNTLPQQQRQRNELLRQFWLENATAATTRVNDAHRLTELVHAALVTPAGQTLLLSTPMAHFRINDSKTKYIPLSYPEGTILAYIENDQADQDLNATMLGVLPAERLQRQQRNEKLQRARTLGKLDISQKKQSDFLIAEIQQRRQLYKRYLELWKRGDLPGITLLDEQSRINTLEGQLLSANSTQINSGINQQDQVEQSKQAELDGNVSLNKLENHLISYLNSTTIFSPIGGFYILTRNFLNGSLVKQGDELISFTRTPPALPSLVPVFLDSSAAQQVSEGMQVLVTPKGISRAQYGGIPGRVLEVSKLPLQGDGLQGAVGSRALVGPIQSLIPSPYLVRVELEQTGPDQCLRASSIDCYRWSSGRQPPHPVRLATLADVQITTTYRRPIEFVMPAIRAALGMVVDSQ